MQKRNFLIKSAALLCATSLMLSGCTTTPMSGANTTTKRQELDASANSTLKRLSSTVPGSHELINKARGVLVFPSVLAAGLGVGGEYGEGALRINGKTADYYSIAAGSFGLQIGAQSKAIIFLFMTQEALDKFRSSQGWTAGVDASVAVIKAGANGEVDLNTATQPVNVFVMTNQGLMANLTVQGIKITKLKTQ
ncbi:MAG TPA: YSC84-related protein [Burkholderiaceae bacterium]|nr:YSC84-related protein [Burkholderiaceae bacterium]